MTTPFLQRVYDASPLWLQNLQISAFGLLWYRTRFGPGFDDAVREFQSREFWSPEEWEIYQTQALRRLLTHAFLHVPYYTRTYTDAGFTLADLQAMRVADLTSLPILEKQDIRERPQDFLATPSGTRGTRAFSTSGTTGTPIEIVISAEGYRRWQAAKEARCHIWAGVHRTMSRATFGGRTIIPDRQVGPPYWRYNAVERQLYMSAFHIAAEGVEDYVNALNRFQPDYLGGYASSHYFLARLIAEAGLEVHQPRAMVLTAEKLTDEMREVLTSVYDCPIHDTYSGVEMCCLVSQSEDGLLMSSPDVGIVELLDDEGQATAADTVGEIVATGLVNSAQPLIRYRTGDLSQWDERSCPRGRNFPVLTEILGRQEGVVTLKDGRRSASFYKVFQGVRGVLEAQAIQRDYDRFEVRMVTDSAFSAEEQARLLANVHRRYGDVTVDVKVVDAIPRTANGKFRFFVSEVGESA